MRGGQNEERLFLFNYDKLDVKKTDMPNLHDLIARHEARYHLAAFLARPGMKVLDFPCGSGYGGMILADVEYYGMDNDNVTIEYANSFYKDNFNYKRACHKNTFYVDDMTNPQKIEKNYDLILCIEGLEHIEQQYQQPLIEVFYNALNPGGRLLISMPEAKDVSGPNYKNSYHLWELTREDFKNMLKIEFDNVQVLYHEDTLHNGEQTSCMYGICKKGV